MAAARTSEEAGARDTRILARPAPATAPRRLPTPTNPKIRLACVTVYFSLRTSQNSKGARLPSIPVQM